jgi:hypothetical protein
VIKGKGAIVTTTITVWNLIQAAGFFLSVVIMPIVIVRLGKKTGIETMAEEITKLRTEQKIDINELYKKIDINHTLLLNEFKEHCEGKQVSCSGVVNSKLEHTKERISSVCRKVEEIRTEQKTKWERQEDVNYKLIHGGVL